MTTQYSSAPASGCQVSDWGPETTVAPRWSDKPAIVRSALIGEAVAEQSEVKRSGERLLVKAQIDSPVRLLAQTRIAQDRSDTPVFADAP